MTLVIDASTIVAALTDGGPVGEWSERQLAFGPLVAPHLLPVEVTHVLRRGEQTGVISPDVASLAYDNLRLLPVELSVFDLVAERVWELRHNVTSYDAWYVALAELLDAPLVTLDSRLAAAPGPRCTFITPAAST